MECGVTLTRKKEGTNIIMCHQQRGRISARWVGHTQSKTLGFGP